MGLNRRAGSEILDFPFVPELLLWNTKFWLPNEQIRSIATQFVVSGGESQTVSWDEVQATRRRQFGVRDRQANGVSRRNAIRIAADGGGRAGINVMKRHFKSGLRSTRLLDMLTLAPTGGNSRNSSVFSARLYQKEKRILSCRVLSFSYGPRRSAVMWNKRREEETTKFDSSPSQVVGSAPLATNPLEIGKEITPVPSILMAKAEFDSPAGSATIGKTVKFVGQVYSKEDLVVDGDLEGTLEVLDHKLTIGPTGRVNASVKAREVVVLGTLQGNVEAADRIEIRRDAKVVGDLRIARIFIEDGAYFKGSIDIVKPEPVKTPANRQAAVLAAAPNQTAGTGLVSQPIAARVVSTESRNFNNVRGEVSVD